MGAPALLLFFPLALLVHQAGGGCVSSWVSADSGTLGPCDSCLGTCDSVIGCFCVDGVQVCLPDVSSSCPDPNACCPSGLYYHSEESCCTETPICHPECATDEVCETGTCVCNPSYHQHETLADFRPIEVCDVSTMTVSIGRCQLSSLGYEPTSVHLINSSAACNYLIPDVGSTEALLYLEAQTAPGWCGNTETELESRRYVTNSIYINAQNNASDPIIFPITCPILTGTFPNAGTSMISGVNGSGLYPLTIAAYKDPGFGNLYEYNDVILGPKIYVALYVYYTDPDYVLRLQDCTASPTGDHMHTEAIQLISDGCATDNVTRVIQNGNSTEVRMEISYDKFQNFSTVRLFCDVRLCVRSTEECTMCKGSQFFSMGVTTHHLDLMIRGKSPCQCAQRLLCLRTTSKSVPP